MVDLSKNIFLQRLSDRCKKLSSSQKSKIRRIFCEYRQHHQEELISKDYLKNIADIVLPLPGVDSKGSFLPWQKERNDIMDEFSSLHELPLVEQSEFLHQYLTNPSITQMIFSKRRVNG